MRRIFSVSMPRAGHHVAEMILRGLFGDRFAYCEFYTIADCCKQIPCARMKQHEADGALVFMQKSHDHKLTDPVPAGVDGLFVQVREPVARALSNYELDLRTVGPPHSDAYQKFWLGMEAAYSDGFFRKWCALDDPRVLIVHYEDLLAHPAAYFKKVFAAFALAPEYFDANAINRMQGVSSAGDFQFKLRDPNKSKYYDRGNYRDYATLVADAASLAGYEVERGPPLAPDSAIHQSFTAYQALQANDLEGALRAFRLYAARPDAHYCGYQQCALLHVRLGQVAEAEDALRKLLEIDPTYVGAYIDIAAIEASRSETTRARETLSACLTHTLDAAKTYERIKLRFEHRPDIIPEFAPPPAAPAPPPEPKKPPLDREDVLAGFRFILGREPEAEAVIAAHQNIETIDALRIVLLRSEEFRAKYEAITAASASGDNP